MKNLTLGDVRKRIQSMMETFMMLGVTVESLQEFSELCGSVGSEIKKEYNVSTLEQLRILSDETILSEVIFDKYLELDRWIENNQGPIKN